MIWEIKNSGFLEDGNITGRDWFEKLICEKEMYMVDMWFESNRRWFCDVKIPFSKKEKKIWKNVEGYFPPFPIFKYSSRCNHFIVFLRSPFLQSSALNVSRDKWQRNLKVNSGKIKVNGILKSVLKNENMWRMEW